MKARSALYIKALRAEIYCLILKHDPERAARMMQTK